MRTRQQVAEIIEKIKQDSGMDHIAKESQKIPSIMRKNKGIARNLWVTISSILSVRICS